MRCGSKSLHSQVFCFLDSGHPDDHRNGSFHWSSSIVREQWALVRAVEADDGGRAYEYRRQGPGRGSSNGLLFASEFSRRARPSVEIDGEVHLLDESGGCVECWEGWPFRCLNCGGLVHAQFGDEDGDCNYWLAKRCDGCGPEFVLEDE